RERANLREQLRQSAALRPQPRLLLERAECPQHRHQGQQPRRRRRLGAFKDKEKNALPVWLKKAGYKKALIGKYINRYGQESTFGSLLSWAGSYLHIGFTSPTIGNPEDWVPPGWDLWYAFTGTRARYYDYDINENDKIKTFGSSAGDYSTDVLKA